MNDNWETPKWLFNKLNAYYMFDLDAAATKENAKCAQYITPEMDATNGLWSSHFNWKTAFINPPFGRLSKDPWIEAIAQNSWGNRVVALLPMRLETKWAWQMWQYTQGVVIMKGRLSFELGSAPAKGKDYYGTVLVIFGKRPTPSEFAFLAEFGVPLLYWFRP